MIEPKLKCPSRAPYDRGEDTIVEALLPPLPRAG